MSFENSVNPMHVLLARAERDRVAGEAEEGRTPYSARELAEGWEFKIIRSPRQYFGRPEYRERILAEEAQAGWSLVEVFDNGRIRLKRPPSAGDSGAAEGYDSYRTVLDDSREPGDPAIERALGVACLVGLVVTAVAVGMAAGIF